MGVLELRLNGPGLLWLFRRGLRFRGLGFKGLGCRASGFRGEGLRVEDSEG